MYIGNETIYRIKSYAKTSKISLNCKFDHVSHPETVCCYNHRPLQTVANKTLSLDEAMRNRGR